MVVRRGDLVLFHRARGFGRDTHGAVREEGDTRLASQISRINPSDQWGDRCRSQIALTSAETERGGAALYQRQEQDFTIMVQKVCKVMAGKVVLHYFNGRGKMESIRWLLTVAEVEFDEIYLSTREQYEKLLSDGALMFQQVPMVEIDGMKACPDKSDIELHSREVQPSRKQSQRPCHINVLLYVPMPHRINMYCEGVMDLMEMIMILPFTADPNAKLSNIETKAKERYLPVFEKALSESVHLVGGKLSCADVELLECTLMLEEKFPAILADFPNVKSFQGRMRRIPAISRFLQPGSKRKQQPDETYVKTVMEVFNMKFPLLKKPTVVMAGKVVLHYFNGRGKMESIRWLLTVAEVEFDEIYLSTREQYEKLLSDGALMFQQVPMVEIDGMKLVQTKAILNYIAEKYNLHGSNLKDRVMINMYCEGVMDLMEMIMILPFTADPNAKLSNIETKAKERYLPVFEKALSESVHLVGGKLSCADVELLECTLMLEEKFPAILADFPNVKSFQGRMRRIPAISRFLQPGSKRKQQPDETLVKTVMEVFNMKFPLP
ncbi:hypothetical protein L3Q82_011790 [Scortum barcoo]|uniref:Uncharacterized protein n=1 Tax=Scortum barcoo TaxID=214431 RepID=A0ACB8W5S2_9TELE|nr:hypothetical protein L3Q82_011790 [Scortum barcoo]